MPIIRTLLERYHTVTDGLHPAKLAGIGYLTYIVAGWIFLCIPFSQKGTGAGALDNLFVATSAISTTGLSPVSVSDCYSYFGQIVILVLIQLGGIGYMTFGSFVILSRKASLPPGLLFVDSLDRYVFFGAHRTNRFHSKPV